MEGPRQRANNLLISLPIAPASPSDSASRPVSKTTTVSLVHLGCARNLIDSELMLARMAEEGCRISGSMEMADVGVVNTCSFIGPAREESENAIRELVAKKRRGELNAVVVAGCLVQRLSNKIEERFPEVDLFAEISDYAELAKAVAKLGRGQQVPRYLAAGGLREATRDGARMLATPGSYAYLRISHGCDHTCSFCAIPGIRGTHRSKSADDVCSEAEELIAAGVKELVIVAEDSTAWGRDIGSELPVLVERLADLPGDHQIRLMYAYPNNFPWGLTRLLREHPRVVPYLDIPVQHIATPVLRAMRRAGNGDQVRKLLDRLREEVPGITLRSTLLVGFPGESEADAGELPDFIREYGLGRMGAFTYSHEEDTPAFAMEDSVSKAMAAERYEAVLAARDEVLEASQAAQIGKTLEVLIDEVHETRAVGRTLMDAPEVDPLVIVEDIQDMDLQVGDRIQVAIEAMTDDFSLVGKPA
jgi:ribosomal protein S12 methylthiotransferase